jgi:hypothetical protein
LFAPESGSFQTPAVTPAAFQDPFSDLFQFEVPGGGHFDLIRGWVSLRAVLDRFVPNQLSIFSRTSGVSPPVNRVPATGTGRLNLVPFCRPGISLSTALSVAVEGHNKTNHQRFGVRLATDFSERNLHDLVLGLVCQRISLPSFDQFEGCRFTLRNA